MSLYSQISADKCTLHPPSVKLLFATDGHDYRKQKSTKPQSRVAYSQ